MTHTGIKTDGFAFVEDNAGGLHLYGLASGQVVVYSGGLEHWGDALKAGLETLRDGDDISDWVVTGVETDDDGIIRETGETTADQATDATKAIWQADWESVLNDTNGCYQIVYDEDGLYCDRDRLGASAEAALIGIGAIEPETDD